ncbi:hypothetical protein RV134_310329 [Roseovarius sp. EC-HK134]|nr:hypothetical protein RV134_310329 [Roseovarius sp. EC-HK134]
MPRRRDHPAFSDKSTAHFMARVRPWPDHAAPGHESEAADDGGNDALTLLQWHRSCG